MKIMTLTDQLKRNELTEHSSNYRYVNPNILQCYIALHPATNAKVAICLFQILIKSRRYKESTKEDKRIFTNIPLTSEDILRECFPFKYNLDGRDPKTDISNLQKVLKQLHDENIFYMWSSRGKPSNMIFVMERDIGVWKYYNPSAYVPPKTLLKIINGALSPTGLIQTMANAVKGKSNPSLRDEFGEFLDDLISKMRPEIAEQLPKWAEYPISISDHITELTKILATMDAFDGLDEDKTFIQRLPVSVATSLSDKRLIHTIKGKGTSKTMDLQSIIPTDGNLTKKKAKRATQLKQVEQKPAKLMPFHECNPFSNENEFIRYYQACVKLININAKFCTVAADRVYAAKILDTMTDEGLSGDKIFLKKWISFYVNICIRGKHVRKVENTSLQAFLESFKTYKAKYYDK